MSNFKLNLPTDIPWERICVTEDMIDPVVCDERLPAKWQTSMAVFKFKPEEEYQLYPNYNITYLKVTATITGYQPLDQEIQGRLDWNSVNADTRFTNEVLRDLLNSYHPCNGAILQVVVGPPEQKPDLALKEYPFFMDFEPKKRELYELATDTSERSSRSIESLNITKSAGSTQSLEILDIDMGGGGFGVNASYAGTGGGFNYQAPNGQWGTKRINADESLTARSSDVGQEKRETFSFSTHISQMYNLLNSYHTGTNRVVFFVQPRPHTLEEPSGFVRGPRPVEGIQEFFMVVAQLKDQEDFCVSLRLDTSHLANTPIMEYDRITRTSPIVSAIAPVPKWSESEVIGLGYQPGPKVDLYEACFIDCWDVPYIPWRIEKSASETVDAPDGYIIENYTNIRNDVSHGNSDVFISADDSSATITVKAKGLLYQNAGDVVCIDCPGWVDGHYGSATRQISLNLRSKTKVKQIGEEEVLLITTRGLCCCSNQSDKYILDEFVVGIKPIPVDLSIKKYLDKYQSSKRADFQFSKSSEKGHEHKGGSCKECEDKIKQNLTTDKPDARYTIRLANELSNFIKTETIKSLNDPTAELTKYYETDFFAKQLEYKLVQYNEGKNILNESIEKDIPKEMLPKIEKYFGKKVKGITHREFLSLRKGDLSRLTGFKEDDIQKLKLRLMGIKLNPEKPSKKSGKKGGKSSKSKK